MRKSLVLILAFLLLVNLCACDKDTIQTTTPATEPTQETQPVTEATQTPTVETTEAPTVAPTEVSPTVEPTTVPTAAPTQKPTVVPTQKPTQAPTQKPTVVPTQKPTQAPTQKPTVAPTQKPTQVPTQKPTVAPTQKPTQVPTQKPTQKPTDPKYTTYNIPALTQKSKDVAAATIKTFNGTISKEGQVDEYIYTPTRDGQYTFQFSEVRAGIMLNLYIYDRLGAEVDYILFAANGDYLTVDVKAEETYTCKVFQYEEYGNYTLNIGEQTATTDISAFSMVNDSVNHTEQQNNYTFIPARDGRYTFALSEVNAKIVLTMSVYDRLGEEIKRDYYSINGTHFALDLKAGETYTIRVCQNEDFGEYTLNIGKQKETTNIKVNSVVKDSVEFDEQVNIYTFTATRKTHSVAFSNIEKGLVLEAYVLNYLDEAVAEDWHCINGDTLKMDNLVLGQEYTIKIYQYERFGDYTMIFE